jgi:hypothetical protein
MKRSLLLAALVLLPAFTRALPAQDSPPVAVATVAMPSSLAAETAPFSTSALPDAPSASVAAADRGVPADRVFSQSAYSNQAPVANRYATVIQPGQTAVPLHGAEKVAYGFADAFNINEALGFTVSAGWSQLIDSQPHYGRNATAFGKREGAAALRNTLQTLATDAVFSPMFHDDPRYYAMGDGHPFFTRVAYAASRVLIVRSSYSNQQRFNLPLLLGYAAAAGTNNAYYPDQDRGGKKTAQSFGTSLAGAALGFEASEFLHDALRMVHLRRN